MAVATAGFHGPHPSEAAALPPPPFDEHAEAISTGDLVLPAAYRTPGPPRLLQPIHRTDADSIQRYLATNLDVSRLNRIHKHLWLAGLPQIPRSLHEQRRIGRTVALTEQADLHLVWARDTIFIKPLPDYLLNHTFWRTHICPHVTLRECARGLLLSYLWLLPSRIDHALAVEEGVVPPTLSWDAWVAFCTSALAPDNAQRLDHETLQAVNPRYLYGELRLERLSLIYRFCSATVTPRTLLRGYNYGYSNYGTFVARNFAWAITAIVYITIVLTAMQVGLATHQLKDNKRFHDAAFGVTVLSIVTPLAVLAAALGLGGVVFVLNWRFARGQQRKAKGLWPHMGGHGAVMHSRQEHGGSARTRKRGQPWTTRLLQRWSGQPTGRDAA